MSQSMAMLYVVYFPCEFSSLCVLGALVWNAPLHSIYHRSAGTLYCSLIAYGFEKLHEAVLLNYLALIGMAVIHLGFQWNFIHQGGQG